MTLVLSKSKPVQGFTLALNIFAFNNPDEFIVLTCSATADLSFERESLAKHSKGELVCKRLSVVQALYSGC